MKNEAYVALGSNMGNREDYLLKAIQKLNLHPLIDVVNFSSIYETDPIGYTDQAEFLNMVIKLNTDLSAFELLHVLQNTETLLNRKREVKWGPRTLDLDILLYNHENIVAEQLIVPHPRMHERAFVLIPLYEINQNISIPTLEESLSTIIDQLSDKEGVRIWKQKNGVDVFALLES
ncbi:2-amino-4-hydroxy-6-hydroxymethyldihydropteridine diphosphokinase [Metabacillus sediminilitoris]|jgi:2-amino-4-hydroxy-6-hydroxymethyldihydropteridine diphosphokinase|uniref:2-amino-4-hydroxy-6-hydroxymethyldihydropteridine diphosphokinase n=1 Tax=Metabacillus sediminilitoris TaxID=2567941 RepID=A0A4S4BP98_9BACI|nr:2-amino-4-hydroxy-6-hydroxymethyldihydropteridine diphosphokinase [Metabacillus sediminilitoris]QGQ43957.1 2-amino-4-hydroxy-6-hydroxymethyldihydropteridine diphosphokinase [Metabacillus sediminilitoris]THF75830.1 2-amino-4-hydroxy-6-hydroxymethyldihydropteridine diphosphokinase [Metabacillus sediminilitoris]